jgi:multiple sugar transport system substrate-binding protein
MTTSHRGVVALAAVVALAFSAGCGGGDDESNGAAKNGSVDDGTTITMWTRAATQTQSERCCGPCDRAC